jgi:23S rRNA pseudouridine2604 synthase
MAMTRQYDGTEPVRVNKWLAQTGVCSRREAEALIAQGAVAIDGERVNDVGRKINPGQTLTLNDRADAQTAAKVTALVHKPIGYVSAQPEPGQTPAAVLLERARFSGEGQPPSTRRLSLAPLGRLDMDSRGLLILSEDGVLAKAVIGPQSPIDKEYIVTVAGAVTPHKVALLRRGLHLDGRALRPAIVTSIRAQTLRFVLTEGRNRQIRRMCALVDLEVVDLLRTRIGPISLGDIKEGRWRLLHAEERGLLLRAARGEDD